MDLTVSHQNDSLLFSRFGDIVHECLQEEFFKSSEEILSTVSEKTDDNAFLRKITFLSLIIASPLLCYFLLHGLFSLLLVFIKNKQIRNAAAAAACMTVLTIPAVFFHHQRPDVIPEQELAGFLMSADTGERVAALKVICDKNYQIERYVNDFESLLKSRSIVERYWLAKSLGSSRSDKTYQLILELLDDPQPNVRQHGNVQSGEKAGCGCCQ